MLMVAERLPFTPTGTHIGTDVKSFMCKTKLFSTLKTKGLKKKKIKSKD